MNKQLNFSDFYSDFNNQVTKPLQLLELIDEFAPIGDLIPISLSTHYYKKTGRPHVNSLDSIISCLLLQKLLSIPTIELLIVFLSFSAELRDFCRLCKVPDPTIRCLSMLVPIKILSYNTSTDTFVLCIKL